MCVKEEVSRVRDVVKIEIGEVVRLFIGVNEKVMIMVNGVKSFGWNLFLFKYMGL